MCYHARSTCVTVIVDITPYDPNPAYPYDINNMSRWCFVSVDAEPDTHATGMSRRNNVGTTSAEQHLQDQFIGLIGALGDLLQHHLPLGGEVMLHHRRMQHQIQQQIQGTGGLLGGNQHVEMHVVESGGCIGAASESFNLSIEGSCWQLIASLEHEVFKEVRHPLLTPLLVGASSATPEIEASQCSFRHRRCDDTDAVGQFPTVEVRPDQRSAQNYVAKFHSVPAAPDAVLRVGLL